MDQDKSYIRKLVKQKRLDLSLAQVTNLSQVITQQLIDFIDWQIVKNIHVYKSIPYLNEVDTTALVQFLRKAHPDIKIHFPDSHPLELDIIVVPLVAFDARGNRLGQGGGYYDRFLKNYSHSQKIGLAYELQKVDTVSENAHDIPLNVIVTEKHTYQF